MSSEGAHIALVAPRLSTLATSTFSSEQDLAKAASSLTAVGLLANHAVVPTAAAAAATATVIAAAQLASAANNSISPTTSSLKHRRPSNSTQPSRNLKKPRIPSAQRLEKASTQLMAANEAAGGSRATAAAGSQNKPKRVRTGCLTCRERHLKCDEGLPICLNCKKSARECKRGVRLNFIDTQCEAPPTLAPNDDEWQLNFLDESRDIAGEYTDGLSRYANVDQLDPGPAPFSDPHLSSGPTYEGTPGFNQYPNGHAVAAHLAHQSLPSIQGMSLANGMDSKSQSSFFDQSHQMNGPRIGQTMNQHQQSYSHHPGLQAEHAVAAQFEAANAMDTSQDQPEVKNLLDTADETLYMQVFVEEVGVWMDSMDSMKHFSRIMPFHALNQPMLLNAFLACGVRHLTLVNPLQFREEKALEYYDVASRYLLQALQNPNRDSVICATTAVILNVYEIMTEKALPRMNHIAGARALIKECGWSARSSGIGAACFWLNVGLEALSNLHFNWQMSWDPNDWGLDMDLSMETVPGREEIWTHRMLFIIAKICNFRATAPRGAAAANMDPAKRQARINEWADLKTLLDTWEANSPRTMKPMAYLFPYQTTSKSAFPEVWIIKRTSIIARLFYHTASVLLTQTYPAVVDMRDLELQNAHMICGIVAHVKDRGVASVALRCLAHAAEALTNRREQEEVLEIFTRIHRETGWRIGFIPKDLCEKWGWGPNDKVKASPRQLPTHTDPTSHLSPSQQQRMAVQAQAAAAATGMSVTPSLESVTSPATLSLGSPASSTTQYQFDQYAEMQQWKAQQAAAQAQQQQHNHQQQHQQQQQQQEQQRRTSAAGQNSSPPVRKLPQGIVNPAFSNGLPKAYQEYYVPALAAPAPADHGPGLGLGLSSVNAYGHVGNGGYQF